MYSAFFLWTARKDFVQDLRYPKREGTCRTVPGRMMLQMPWKRDDQRTWMINNTMGCLGSKTVGLRPSMTPPCGGTVMAGAADETVDDMMGERCADAAQTWWW